ncbi:hypothetical protein ADIS_4767 [Lunatimonas lonarensis]|uniref:Hemoglobin n=1 Tax=Lunatimonas lonarensis TaxID=1232681 RepID=R7ZL19_9BACT|nr:hypothetical protein ADIS_4767 [Lunatimonas lonarensis]
MQIKKQLASRSEVSLLVRSFYHKVRQHDRLGPVFNLIIHDWDVHLERLTDFWEMVLLNTGPGAGKFNPVPVHREVDRRMDEQVDQAHFGNWLELWFSTVDEHFEGIHATYAKEHARKMAHILFFRILEGRQRQNE